MIATAWCPAGEDPQLVPAINGARSGGRTAHNATTREARARTTGFLLTQTTKKQKGLGARWRVHRAFSFRLRADEAADDSFSGGLWRLLHQAGQRQPFRLSLQSTCDERRKMSGGRVRGDGGGRRRSGGRFPGGEMAFFLQTRSLRADGRIMGLRA